MIFVNAETLNESTSFHSPFLVLAGSRIVSIDVEAPQVFLYVDREGNGVGEEEVDDSTWVPVNGYSGQHGYRGPCMHSSESLGGRMARDVLVNIGAIYSLAVVECMPNWDGATEEETDTVRGGEPAGWMLLRMKSTAEDGIGE